MKPRRVKVPLFEMVANPTVRIGDIKTRRFFNNFCPICDRTVPNLASHISEMDDDAHAVLEVMES